MKNNIAILAALAITSPAFADELIRMTGSTAYRAQTHTALVTATPAGLGFTQIAFTGSSASGAKYAIYEKGTSPNKTTLKTNWTGSVAGVLTVAQQRTDVLWLPDVGTSTPNGTVVAGGGNTENRAIETGPGTAPDIAFSDCAQTSTIFRTPVLQDNVVGIVQFRWITNYNSPINSINYQQVRAVFGTSTGVPLSMFTGNVADSGKRVFGIGRDQDSGTRVICLAETGLGATSNVIHWQTGLNTGTGAVDTLIPWPAYTLFGLPVDEGNGGYASGGDLVRSMRYSSTAVSVGGGPAEECYFVAMVGVNDVSTALAAHNPPTTVGAGPAKVISFENNDGPSFGASATAVSEIIKNGSFPCWSYLHCMHLNLTGAKLTFYNDVVALLQGTVSNNLSVNNMNVQRLGLGDGTVILPK
jgi:hypothetical protein